MTFDLLLRAHRGRWTQCRGVQRTRDCKWRLRVGRVSAHDAEQVIDVDGQIVAPGFIDLHTHYDAQVFWDPYCSLSGWHGVTSVVIGNCGFGFAPVRAAERDRAMLSMTRVEAIPMGAMQKGMPWIGRPFPSSRQCRPRGQGGQRPGLLAIRRVDLVLGLGRAKAAIFRLPVSMRR